MAQKLPLWRNLRWPQLVYGGLATLLGYQILRHVIGAEPLSGGALAGRILLLAVATLVFVVYLQNVYRFGLVPDYSRKCRFCNGPVNRYSEFCEHCGADLISEEKLVACPSCGVEVYSDTKFCPECGATVAKPAKGKKGHKKRREAESAAAAQPQGWDAPLDASGFPPEERR